jgi:hypothetical protein|tara:strand:+ start:5200 stop:5568 length:369 start_codon:yes stop_codon:yes gene_type:complete
MKITESKVREIIREELLRLAEQEEPKPQKLDDLDFKSKEHLAYDNWAVSNGYVSSEVRSTLVAYLVDQGLQNSHDLHDKLAKELGFKHDDIMRDLGQDSEEETLESERILNLESTIKELSKL